MKTIEVKLSDIEMLQELKIKTLAIHRVSFCSPPHRKVLTPDRRRGNLAHQRPSPTELTNSWSFANDPTSHVRNRRDNAPTVRKIFQNMLEIEIV